MDTIMSISTSTSRPMIPLLLHLALQGILGVRPVAAQSCNDITITSQSDASIFDECNDVRGDVTISPSATGSLNLDGLEDVRGNLIVEDTGLTSIVVPDVERIRGSVSVRGNEQLTRLGLDGVADIEGDLRVQGNEKLAELRMDDLERIRGGLYLDGGFNSISFGSLQQVDGNSEVVTTGSATCSDFGRLNSGGEEDGDDSSGSSGVFRGSYTCETSTPSPSSTDPAADSDPNSSSDGDSGLSGGAIAGIVVGVIVGVLIVLFLIWFCIRQSRKRQAAAAAAAAAGAIAGGTLAGAAGKGAGATTGDVEKQPNQNTTPTSTSAPAAAMGAGAAAAGAGAAAGGGTGGVIPRRPVSTAPTATTESTDPSSGSWIPSSLTPGSQDRSSLPVPPALIPGTGAPIPPGPGTGPGPAPPGVGGEPGTGPGGDPLFLTAVPMAGRPPPRQRRPSESDVPMLDSGNVHEVSGVPVTEARGGRPGERNVGGGAVFELDGGFQGASHQRVIHREGGTNEAGVNSTER
ncbi:hypothetical protein BJX61DRAFT_409612 [Aspergillus egyptiacus]|nr:hypothetical protein BJX61DRAFT_409612 [Aspergillus egyptiacus]